MSLCTIFEEKSGLGIVLEANIVVVGVATFVQGTVVQGDLGTKGQMSKEQLSKKILVRGDFCPRKLLPVISLLKLFFHSLLDIATLIE